VKQERGLAEMADLKKRLGGVLGQHVERLKGARAGEFEEELQTLKDEESSDNVELKALQNLIATEADFEPWIRDSCYLQMLKTKFSG